jgi:hypothetical protein
MESFVPVEDETHPRSGHQHAPVPEWHRRVAAGVPRGCSFIEQSALPHFDQDQPG